MIEETDRHRQTHLKRMRGCDIAKCATNNGDSEYSQVFVEKINSALFSVQVVQFMFICAFQWLSSLLFFVIPNLHMNITQVPLCLFK